MRQDLGGKVYERPKNTVHKKFLPFTPKKQTVRLVQPTFACLGTMQTHDSQLTFYQQKGEFSDWRTRLEISKCLPDNLKQQPIHNV